MFNWGIFLSFFGSEGVALEHVSDAAVTMRKAQLRERIGNVKSEGISVTDDGVDVAHAEVDISLKPLLCVGQEGTYATSQVYIQTHKNNRILNIKKTDIMHFIYLSNFRPARYARMHQDCRNRV